MDKIWFIQVNGHSTGPFSVQDLKQDRRITPDTLVWKKGFPRWVPIRYVPELQEIFEEPEPSPETEEKDQKRKGIRSGKETIALDARRIYPPIIFWLIILLIVSIFLVYVHFT